ncbi:MAG: formylglycine-generating enzyme family protein [Dysgonamonadaceae bacterium]|nr:formylglycine-generating enzyme family protein [Dysgonamonadaceae bacterium]
MKQISILLVLCCTVSLAYCQNYRQEADKCLVAGDYECARRNLRLLRENEPIDVTQELQNVEVCIKASTLADYFFEEKEYEKAAQQYDKILKLNPKDTHAKSRKSQCEKASAPPARPSSGANYTERVSGTSIDMVYVAGGTFTMGCTAEQGSDCYDWEKPAHRVTVSDFYIGKYEVTQAQWKAVMGNNPSSFKGDNLPVENVNWDEAMDFCRELSRLSGKKYRLPTEAEWEYAARGGKESTGAKYSGSSSPDRVAWYDSNSTHPVGTKAANELGIYDMSGNVYEWCSDWYGAYSSSSQTNPTGASSGSRRVIRGGSWYFDAQGVRVPYRDSSPDDRNYILGFRLASSSK